MKPTAPRTSPVTSFLTAANRFFTRWEKLLTVPGSALSLLLSIAAITISIFAFLHTRISPSIPVRGYIGNIEVYESLQEDVPFDGMFPDSLQVGSLKYKLDIDSPAVESVLTRYDGNRWLDGYQLVFNDELTIDLLTAMALQCDPTTERPSPAHSGDRADTVSAFIDSLSSKNRDDLVPYALRALSGTNAQWSIPVSTGTFPISFVNISDNPAIIKSIRCRMEICMIDSARGNVWNTDMPLFSSEWEEPFVVYRELDANPFPILLNPGDKFKAQAILEFKNAERILKAVEANLALFFDRRIGGWIDVSIEYDEQVARRSGAVVCEAWFDAAPRMWPRDFGDAKGDDLVELWGRARACELIPYRFDVWRRK